MTPRYLESYFEILSYHLKVVTKNEVTSFTFYFLIPYSMTSAVGKVTKGQKSVVSSMQLMWQLLESRPSEIAQSCPTVCNPMDCSLPHSSVHGIFPGKSTGVGCQILLQRIFPTQGSNPGLPHCRQTLYHLSHQGSLDNRNLSSHNSGGWKSEMKVWTGSLLPWPVSSSCPHMAIPLCPSCRHHQMSNGIGMWSQISQSLIWMSTSPRLSFRTLDRLFASSAYYL